MRYGITILTVGILAWVALGCRSNTVFSGQLTDREEDPWGDIKLDRIRGTAYLLLEEHFETVGLDIPPDDAMPTTETFSEPGFEYRPEGWRLYFGGKVVGEGTELLLEAPLDASGAFSFENIPPGTHWLYISWQNNPHPRDAKAGPYLVRIEKGKSLHLELPTGRFDVIFA